MRKSCPVTQQILVEYLRVIKILYPNCLGMIKRNMRAFFMILVFAIGLSGYMAGAHAFSGEECAPTHMSHDAGGSEESVDMTLADTSSDRTADLCLDCHHGCVSHAVNAAVVSVMLPPLSNTTNPVAIVDSRGDYFFSLLRPPKSFI